MISTLQLFRSLSRARSSSCLSARILSKRIDIRKLCSFPDSHAHDLGSTERPTDILSWTKEQTTKWLSNVQTLDENSKKVWESLHITGKSLKGISQGVLEKRGMAYGPAFEVASEIKKLINSQPRPKSLNLINSQPPRPQTLETKYLTDLIVNHVEFKRKIKKDCTKPIQLAINDSKFKRVGRDESMQRAVAAFAYRLYDRTRGTGYDRQRNPLAATLTTTGGGKSFFLDELAALRPEDLKLYEDLETMKEIILTMRKRTDMVQFLPEIMQEMREILQNTVAVTITHNGGFNRVTTVDDHKNTSLGLALRALHSYFIGPEAAGGLDFSRFQQVMRKTLGDQLVDDLTLRVAIRCISEHSKKGVLLLVDELMKCEPTVHEVVRQIGICLDECTPSQFNVVVTTLNMLAMKNETKSGRRIEWIPLLPAKYSDAIQLFHKEINRERLQPLSSEAQHSLVALEQCIADCNGHFRSLENLSVLWHQIKAEDPSYSTLIQQLGWSVEEKYGKLKLPLVRAALLGKQVEYDERVPGMPLTYGQYIEMGYFLNTIESRFDLFVPRVSLLQLLLFARKYVKKGSNCREYRYAKVILSMLNLEPNFTWQQYEHFHAHWETLIRLLLCRGAEHTTSPWTIQKLYGAPKGTGNNQPSFYLSRRSFSICQLKSHFPGDLPTDKCLTTQKGLLRRTIIPAANNPGFDIVGFEDKRVDGIESDPVVICIQCKFSDPDAGTKLDKATVHSAQFQTVAQFLPYFEQGVKLDGLTIKKENLFLVVCAFRDVHANAITDLPENTIVLNRDMLKTLYTPSLASRPQFVLPLKEGESTKRIVTCMDRQRMQIRIHRAPLTKPEDNETQVNSSLPSPPRY